MTASNAADEDTNVWETATVRPSYLLIEDVDDDAQLLLRVLERFPAPVPQVTVVRSLSQAIATLQQHCFALLITDLDLPDSRGMATVKAVVGAAQGMPVVVLTGSHDEELGQRAVAAGAQDYLVKGQFHIPELRRVLRYAQERQRLVVALANAKQEAEASLARLTALERLREDLVHMIVHDLRSPLFGMQLQLQTIEARMLAQPTAEPAGPGRSEGTQELRHELRQVLGMNTALVEMVSTILDVHRLDATDTPLHLGTHDLAVLAQEAAEQLGASTARSPVRHRLPSCSVICDGALVRRVFTNLLSNALRFSPPQEPVVIEGEIGGGWVECRVSDRGPGIPEEAQGRIFERFGTLEPTAQGYSTGLGLPLCKMVAERHQGSIGVRSRPGQGTTVWFRLPLLAPVAPG